MTNRSYYWAERSFLQALRYHSGIELSRGKRTAADFYGNVGRKRGSGAGVQPGAMVELLFGPSGCVGGTYGTIVRSHFDQPYQDRCEPTAGLTFGQGAGHAGWGAAGVHAVPGAWVVEGQCWVGTGVSWRSDLAADQLLANASFAA